MSWEGRALGDVRVRALETEEAMELSVAHTLEAGYVDTSYDASYRYEEAVELSVAHTLEAGYVR